ncbi:MAG: hypothetical protein ABMB14_31725, partial [Myxococcota bacterium]
SPTDWMADFAAPPRDPPTARPDGRGPRVTRPGRTRTAGPSTGASPSDRPARPDWMKDFED